MVQGEKGAMNKTGTKYLVMGPILNGTLRSICSGPIQMGEKYSESKTPGKYSAVGSFSLQQIPGVEAHR